MESSQTGAVLKDHITPRQVARAIGVSESTIKRWCDKGMIATTATEGGHRRIALSAALAFIKEGAYPLQAPEALGLPAVTGQTDWSLTRCCQELTQALLAGQEELCRQVIANLFLADFHPARIADQVIRPAFAAIGQQWECGSAAIYQERRACELMHRVIHDLRRMIAPPVGDARLALGGSLSGDEYALPGQLVELVLIHEGWKAHSLGTNLPVQTLCEAVRSQQPRLCWVSLSFIPDPARLRQEFPQLHDACQEAATVLVVGGQALTPELREDLPTTAWCDNLQHLVRFIPAIQ